jgi:enediyne biosynthesis protein E4
MAARGAGFGDLDNDGFIDVAINCNDGHAVVLHNQGNANHWLSIHLIGAASNRDEIGSRIRLVTEEGLELFSYVSTSGSYLSASDKRAHFGLGHP